MAATMDQDEATKAEVVAPIEDRQEEATAAETTTLNHPEMVVDIRLRLRTGYPRLLELLALEMDCRPRPRRLIIMVTAAGTVDMAGMEGDTTRATVMAVATARRLQHLDSTTVVVEEVEVGDTKVKDTGLSLLRALTTAATMADMAGIGEMIVVMEITVAIAARTELLRPGCLEKIGLCWA